MDTTASSSSRRPEAAPVQAAEIVREYGPFEGVTQVGGDLESNINRWKGQFQGGSEPTRTEKKVGELKVTIVEINGTFAGSGMPGAPAGSPKEGWALLAAVVEREGHDAHFFKMTGPRGTVEAARPAFDELIGSLTVKD